MVLRFFLLVFYHISLLNIGFIGCDTPVQDSTGYAKRWNITVCAMLRNAFAYTLEWIEFHRLQGVDHFVLYDDASDDDLRLLPLLYESIGQDDLIDIFPANALRKSRLSDHAGKRHDYNQRQVLQHCFTRYKEQTEWFLNIDVDEFMYSPHYGTIQNFLNVYENFTKDGVDAAVMVSEFIAWPVRFGTFGLVDDFRVRLQAHPSGDIKVLYEPRDERSNLYPMILEANPKRAPHPQLDKNYEELFNLTCSTTPYPELCLHNNGKSIFKANRCKKAYIHWCEDLVGHTTEPPLSELRLDHFPWRSMENVFNKLTSDFYRKKIQTYNKFDKLWFSLVPDGLNKRYIDTVRKAMAVFSHIPLTKGPHFRWREEIVSEDKTENHVAGSVTKGLFR